MQIGDGWIRFTGNGDPGQGLDTLPEQAVTLTVTSPPYWNFVEYGGVGSGYEDSYEAYLAELARVWRRVLRVTQPGGRMVLNVSNMKSRKGREARAFVYPIVADCTRGALDAGWVLFDEIVWWKCAVNRTASLGGRPLFGSYPYPPTPKIMDSVFENVLVLERPGRRAPRPAAVKEASRLTKAQWKEWTQGVWRIPPDHGSAHPASFPLALADRLVRLYSFVGDVVLDPFAGSGTTVLAAHAAGRTGWGYEIAEQYRPLIEAKTRQLTLEWW